MLHGTILSLLPFIVVIPVAVFTRQILPGLMIGLFIGAYMIKPTLLGGVEQALQYILKELAVPDNLRLIAFMYGFGAFVGLVRVSGGVSGFAAWSLKRIRSERGAFIMTWLSTLGTFMAPDFRIITVGPVMKQIFSKLKEGTDKVALVIDATSTPVCAIMPLGTAFIGYMLGLLATASRHQGAPYSAYQLFLLSIPFNFFSLVLLIYFLYYTFFHRQHSSQNKSSSHYRVKRHGTLAVRQLYFETSQELSIPLNKHKQSKSPRVAKKTESDDFPDPLEIVASKVEPKARNLVIPLGLLLGLTLFFTWWDGHFRSASILGALAQANAAKAMLEALLVTLIAAFVLYTLQRQPLQRIIFGFLQGGNEMMGVNVLLVLVWAVSAVSTDLGFVSYTERTIGSLVPAAFIAPAFFVFGCLLSYVIGSSFGTWGILLPLGFSLATTEHAALPLIAGAVFASGTFGGFASPLSDNTVAMATVMKIPVMKYARMKLRYSIVVAGVCTVLYALVGWFYR